MSKAALMKYSNYFIENTYTRGQKIFEEATPFTKLHMIKEGEFELTKTIEYVTEKEQFRRQFDMRELLPHTKHKYLSNKSSRFVKSVENFN